MNASEWDRFCRSLEHFFFSPADPKAGALLTPCERAVLYTIGTGGAEGVHPTDVAQRLGMQRTSVTLILRTLEEKGLIARVQDPEDGRRSHVALTDACSRLREEDLRGFADSLAPVFSALSAEQTAAVCSAFDRIAGTV